MMQASQRVNSIPPYAFATISQRVSAMIADGVDIIRLDIGNPDQPPAPHILETLMTYVHQEDTHGYGGYAGLPQLREAMAQYYQTHFGVSLNPNTEIIPLLGSKEGLANLHLAWLDPGDLTLIPDPGYLVYEVGPRLCGGVTETFPLTPENDWLPDFEAIPAAMARKARLIWLNYPNNPTGALADLAFFKRAVDFCRQYDILLCHDNPYAEVTFDGYQAVSALAVEGAKDVVIEFNSLSKTYNLAGWRIGMAVGNETAVKALASVKTNIDSGIALPVQRMAISALTGDQTWLAERNQVYQTRRDIVMPFLQDIGANIPAPQATLYIWFPAPAGYTDVEFHEKMLTEAHVSIAPGSIYGQQGQGWLRLSISVATPRLEEAIQRLQRVV